MTGFIIDWAGNHGQVIPQDEEVFPYLTFHGPRVFDTEEEALETLVADLDAMILEIRSARRTAMKRYRKIKKSA